MKYSRRKFGLALGAAAISPNLWEAAAAEVEEKGEISRERVMALLDAQGERGIYEDSELFEELRTALAFKLKEHKILRDFPVPDDVEPLLGFQR